MDRQSIRMVILLATISILGIIVTQLFWINKAFDLKEKEFNERVNSALRSVTKQIQTVYKDSSETPTIKQLTSNYFVVSMNDTLHPYLLESFLINEFEKRDIDVNFEYMIYDCYNDSMVYGNLVQLNEETKAIEENHDEPPRWQEDGHYFGVYFPAKQAYIVNRMGIWVFSSVILLFVIIFFGYTMTIILKQKKLSEIKNDFINNMTHEFRTPISTISVSSEMLMKDDIGVQTERRQMYSKMIHDESIRLKTLVEKVLQMADINSNNVKLNRESLDLHEVIGKTVDNMKLMITEKGGDIKTNLEASSKTIFGDKVHLTNIIYNLLDNAIKYSDKKPEIEISTKDAESGVILSIKDNGIGMNKDVQKHIFSKFYRVPTGNIHNVKGFGLGLYYVKTMISAHKGNIKLTSEPGLGSQFDIYLPRK